MFFSTSRKVLDKVAELVKAKSSDTGQTQEEYWLGIDDRDKDGKWVDRWVTTTLLDCAGCLPRQAI